jgi:hypothetical protein
MLCPPRRTILLHDIAGVVLVTYDACPLLTVAAKPDYDSTGR